MKRDYHFSLVTHEAIIRSIIIRDGLETYIVNLFTFRAAEIQSTPLFQPSL